MGTQPRRTDPSYIQDWTLPRLRPICDCMQTVSETDISLSADAIASLFTGGDGQFLCARWGRPMAPVVFGLADETLAIFRAALQAAVSHARHALTEADPESGANWLCFAVRSWEELAGLPDLDRMTGLADLPARLAGQRAASYRLLRFDGAGAIRACFTFLNLGGVLGEAHPGMLAEAVAMGSLLTWARDVVPDPALASLVRAAYDPVLPAVSRDPSHALRLAARLRAPLAVPPADT